MKCSAIKLENRANMKRGRLEAIATENNFFISEKTHNYSFPFSGRKTGKCESLTVTTVNLPEHFQTFNTGSSLNKWSQKKPRLRSSKIIKIPLEDKEFCYDTLESDLSFLLIDLDDVEKVSQSSLDNLKYEVHSDIEKLLLKAQLTSDEEIKEKPKRRNKKHKDKEPKSEKKEKKNTKTIKFSISKPPSPQTEQVIRVDVISNVSVSDENNCNDSNNNNNGNNNKSGDRRNNSKSKMIDDDRIVELKRILNGEQHYDEDFIVKCRQLALKHRRRRL